MKQVFDRIKSQVKRITGSKHFKRYAPLVVVLAIALVTFATCVPRTGPDFGIGIESPAIGEDYALSEPSPYPAAAPGSEPGSAPEPQPDTQYVGPRNPLTGLPTAADLTNVRPLAIMINNASAAQPQVGVSRADIIYEVLVEGGITRMLALYQDVSDVGPIGSIRSSRAYYVDIAQSYDAVYIFAGGSPEAYSILSARSITRLDGTGNQAQIFYRDRERARTMSFEHTLLTSGDLITTWLPTYGFRLEHERGYSRELSFSDDGTPDGGEQAREFTVRFSTSATSGKTTTFSYLDEDGLYYLGQFGRSYKDGNDDVQLAFTNVLILKTGVSNIPGDAYGRIRVATTGSGTGYFICGGRYVEIRWSREDLTSQFQYTLEDGSELVLGRGRTYICVVPTAAVINFE